MYKFVNLNAFWKENGLGEVNWKKIVQLAIIVSKYRLSQLKQVNFTLSTFDFIFYSVYSFTPYPRVSMIVRFFAV